jgi:hypothetical protein
VNNLKSIGNVAKFSLLGLWLMAIIGLIITGVKQATEHAFNAEVISKNELNIKANDTLRISMTGFDRYNNYSYSDHNDFRITENDNGRSIISSDIKLIVYSTTDSIARVKIVKEARGSNYTIAKERAENINYDYSFVNNELLLDAYHSTDVKNKYSEQEVRVIVYLPQGTIIQSDENTSKYKRRSYNNYNSILANTTEGNYLKVIKNDTECLDCIEEIEETDIIETPKNNDSSSDEKPNVSIQINDEDGVNIEVNDN